MLTKDSLRNALAEAQSLLYSALSLGNTAMADVWGAECDRIETLLETYDD